MGDEGGRCRIAAMLWSADMRPLGMAVGLIEYAARAGHPGTGARHVDAHGIRGQADMERIERVPHGARGLGALF